MAEVSDRGIAPAPRVSASTALADALGVYVKYEGTIAGQDSSHALTAGLRETW